MPNAFTHPNPSIWRGRNIFVTGHTGFKGAWLTLFLTHMGARIHGYALPATNPPGMQSLFNAANIRERLASHTEADIRDRRQLENAWRNADADVVIHLAAQPLVRESYRTPYETFDVNIMGTAAVLETLRLASRPAAAVIVTTDKCYENTGQTRGYHESDPFGGYDPYSASKAAAEIIAASYRQSFFSRENTPGASIRIATARAGNVIGGGDWSVDRLIPDMARALAQGRTPEIRNPNATRPWQHVMEPLFGYLALAEQLIGQPDNPVWQSGWNFGPRIADAWPVAAMADAFCAQWGAGAQWRDISSPDAPHEAEQLRLCIDKAEQILGWTPKWGVDVAVARTAAWYRAAQDPDFDAAAACMADWNLFAEDDSGITDQGTRI